MNWKSLQLLAVDIEVNIHKIYQKKTNKSGGVKKTFFDICR